MIWKYLQVGGAALGLALAASILFAWKTARLEQAQLREELKMTQQALADANDRQKARDTAMAQELGKLAKQKSSVKSPHEIVDGLPDVLPLLVPLRLSEDASPLRAGDRSETESGGKKGAIAGKNSLLLTSPEPKVELPTEDLKPLYDFAVDCKACQVRLAAAESDLKDEKVKTAALGRERDSALRAARGGSVARRIVRAAKWFVIGAAAGAMAVKLAH